MEQPIGLGLRKEYERAVCCLFNLYAEHIMRNAGLDELQAGIKIDGKNINNLPLQWYADDAPLMAEREEELESLLMRVKEKSESSLKTKYFKN